MVSCRRCEEAAEAQREAMAPREVREGYAVLSHVRGLQAYGDMPFPDVRLGDVVKVSLVAAAVPDVGWCEECE